MKRLINLKAMPLRPVLETTPFKHGKSMTEQLIQERKKIERSAIGPGKAGNIYDHQQGIVAMSYKLPSDLAEKIKSKAKEQGISQRELLRRALRMYFGDNA